MAKKEKKPLDLKVIKKKTVKTIDATKNGIKKVSNINRYNRKLFILETILFIGVLDEYMESLILKVDAGFYINVILLMASIGILFTFALKFIEKVAKGAITWIVRLNDNKILRVAVHILILGILFYLYSKVYFDVELGLDFSINITAE